MDNKKIEYETLLVEIPQKLNQEINKYLAEQSGGKSLRGMKKVMVVKSIYEYLKSQGWNIPTDLEEECGMIMDNGNFQI